MIVHLVQYNDKGKIKFLTLTLEETTITKLYGLIGGKTQTRTSTYKIKNVGKSNETSAVQSALNEMNKVIKTKEKEGYKQAASLEPEDIPTFEDPFDTFQIDVIDKRFCCSKPTQKITEEEIDSIIFSSSARFFVKYNGGCHYIIINSKFEISIYTRRWDNHTTKYPALVAAIEAENYPAGTMWIVELCIDPLLNMDHMSAFKAFSKISKTDTKDGECKPSQEASHTLQEQYKVKAAVFGVLYYGGEQVHHLPYKDIYECIFKDFKPLSAQQAFFVPQEVIIASGAKAMSIAKAFKKQLEGFVLWDMNQAMEITMNGKPRRRACWKIKARGEMDVIATGGIEGKVANHFGSITIGRYDAEGEFIDMGAISGLKDVETEPAYWTFPCVVEAGYDNRYPDTGLLQFGNFQKKHEDKQPEEVDLFSLG